ncbi:hypothetical protein PCE1_002927 [Barthelona sp. PCE]
MLKLFIVLIVLGQLVSAINLCEYNDCMDVLKNVSVLEKPEIPAISHPRWRGAYHRARWRRWGRPIEQPSQVEKFKELWTVLEQFQGILGVEDADRKLCTLFSKLCRQLPREEDEESVPNPANSFFKSEETNDYMSYIKCRSYAQDYASEFENTYCTKCSELPSGFYYDPRTDCKFHCMFLSSDVSSAVKTSCLSTGYEDFDRDAADSTVSTKGKEMEDYIKLKKDSGSSDFTDLFSLF